MEWYNILVLILGGFGGISGIVGGVVTMYNAKSNKDTIDISNFHSLIEDERTERTLLAKEYHDYKNVVDIRVAEVKKEFELLKEENQKMLRSIYQAYRCKLPPKMSDCPVIKMFTDETMCDECSKKE